MIELHPANADQSLTEIFFLISDLAWTWWKKIDHPQVLQTRISPKIFYIHI